MQRARALLVVFSVLVLLLALVASRRPDLVGRWLGVQRAPDAAPAPLPVPGPSGESPPAANRVGEGADSRPAVPVAPLSASQPRTSVPIEIDLEPSGAIEGRVTDGAGAPAAGRTVSIAALQGIGARATVDAGGGYRREGLIPGVYLVALDPPDGGGEAGGGDSALAEVRKGGTTTVDFLAHRMGRLSGRVTFAGRAAAGAQVRVMEVAPAGTGARVQRAAATAAGDDGFFALDDLPPGAYRVIVSCETREPRPGGRADDDRITGLARAEREVSVQPGENRLDLDLPQARLAGKVVDARTGAPLALVMILVQPMAVAPRGTGFTERYAELESGSILSESDGSFLLSGLAPGNYRITASLAGYRQYVGAVTVGAGVTPLSVPLQPGGGRVEVEIVIPQGVFLPLLNLRVSDGAGGVLGFYPMGGNDVDHATFERTQQLIANLAPGRHVLELEVPGQATYLADVEVSEERTPRVTFVLARRGQAK